MNIFVMTYISNVNTILQLLTKFTLNYGNLDSSSLLNVLHI